MGMETGIKPVITGQLCCCKIDANEKIAKKYNDLKYLLNYLSVIMHQNGAAGKWLWRDFVFWGGWYGDVLLFYGAEHVHADAR